MKNTITPEKLQNVIERFETILPFVDEEWQLDFKKVDVNVTHGPLRNSCGTAHCVSGWYAVACKEREPIKRRIDNNEYCSYTEGSLLLAQDLGFDGIGQLFTWAALHKKIWGNNCGEHMASSEKAFCEQQWKRVGWKFKRIQTSAKSLKDVVEHLKRVKVRLEKRQKLRALLEIQLGLRFKGE